MIRNSRGHKMFFHEINHQLRFLAVNLLQPAQMGFIIGFPHEGFGEHLVPHRSMDILPLFTHDHFRQQGGRRHHIPYPDAGRQHLGKAADIRHIPIFIKGFDRGNMLPFKPQVAVGIVLEHEEPVALGELQDPLPFFQTGGDAGGVLEIGDQVEEFDVRLGFERLFQRREIDPVLFQRHADQPRAEGFDGIERAHKTGRLAQHHVARVAQHFSHQLDGLLGAAGDQELVERPPDPVFLLQVRFEALPQRAVAFGCAVLERIDGPVPENPG